MTVKTILSTKGSEVITIAPTATLEEAIAVLAKHRIGAVVVLGAEQRVIGILSERDIVRALSEHGASALKQPLAQTMTRVVVTCGEADTVSDLMERMTRGRFRHIPVLEQDRLVGIISIGDVVKQRLGEMERESERCGITSRRREPPPTPPPAACRPDRRPSSSAARPRTPCRPPHSRNSRSARSAAWRRCRAGRS